MWSSIQQIIKPATLDEALIMLKEPGSALLSGGSHLTASRNPGTHTLIDISHLLENFVSHEKDGLHIQAACTLQELITVSSPELSQVIRHSCPSKNIRNQRSLGGEIAAGRADSDLNVFLLTAGTQLMLHGASEPVFMSAWDGIGIIVKVILPPKAVKLERVSVLDSAPAFVIVAFYQDDHDLRVSVGGKTDRILSYAGSSAPDEDDVRALLKEVESAFVDDHFGSAAYKCQLVCNLLKELAKDAPSDLQPQVPPHQSIGLKSWPQTKKETRTTSPLQDGSKAPICVQFQLNGRLVETDQPPGLTLLEYLRGEGIHSPKHGCDHGECGACTVLLDGRSVNACLILMHTVDGRKVETLENLWEHTRLHPIQQHFLETGAAQCGYCTPGMILSIEALKREGGSLDEEKVRDALAGNLCRCTGYVKPVEAGLKGLRENLPASFIGGDE